MAPELVGKGCLLACSAGRCHWGRKSRKKKTRFAALRAERYNVGDGGGKKPDLKPSNQIQRSGEILRMGEIQLDEAEREANLGADPKNKFAKTILH